MNIINKLASIPSDKVLHFAVGTIVGTVGAFSAPFVGIMPAVGALASSTAVGLAKELWDGAGHGNQDGWDWLATILGSVPLASFAWWASQT